MNRRDALKSMLAAAASALVPSWIVPGRPSHGIDLSAFCAPEWMHTRHRLAVPFVQQGIVDDPQGVTRPRWDHFRYATDSRVCVRVPINTGDLIDREMAKLPPAYQLSWNHDWPYRGRWLPWPKADYLLASDSNCLACNATGNKSGEVGLECDECDGYGQVVVGEYETRRVKCRPCKGRGILTAPDDELCPACNGEASGIFQSVQRLPVGYIDAAYHAKVATLPGVEFFEPAVPWDNNRPVMLRFAGGQGLLMLLVSAAAE